MALKTIDIIERTRARVAPAAPATLVQKLDYEIEVRIPGALARLARAVAASSEYRVLQRDFAATPVAGKVDLSAAEFVKILIDSLENKATIALATGATPIIRAPRLQSFYATTQGDVIHFIVRGKRIEFKDTAGSLTAFVAPVVITANYIPLLADEGGLTAANFPLPLQLEDTLIDMIVETFQKGNVSYLKPDDDEVQQITNQQ